MNGQRTSSPKTVRRQEARFDSSDLYAPLAGARVAQEGLALGGGAEVVPCYMFMFSHPIVAFSPAPRNAPHPAPWKEVVGSSQSFEAHCELRVPVSYDVPPGFDRLNTVWFIAALLRLRLGGVPIVPVLSDHSFVNAGAAAGNATIWAVEGDRFLRARLSSTRTEIDSEDASWLSQVLAQAAALYANNESFAFAFMAFDHSAAIANPKLMLLNLWGAVEELFSGSHAEVTLRVAYRMATYLEPPGHTRRALAKRIAKLYSVRSKAAHTARHRSVEECAEIHELLRRVFLQAFEVGRFPTHEELDDRVLGVT